MAFQTAFQPNAFQASPLAFQISAVPIIASINPAVGAQGTTVTVTITGINLGSILSISITNTTVSSLTIHSDNLATILVTIGATAPPGPQTITIVAVSSTIVLPNGFTILLPVQVFPQSGLDYRDMALLGTAATQLLYWDYSNTECFYVLVKAGNGNLTSDTLYRVSPLFANNWFGNQAPSVTYDPFSFNPTSPLSNL